MSDHLSVITIEANCNHREWLHVSIRSAPNMVDDGFYMENGTIAIRKLQDNQSICIHKEHKFPMKLEEK